MHNIIAVHTCKEFSIVKSQVNTNVYWFKESNPNIQVPPSIGSRRTVTFKKDLAHWLELK